MTIKLHIWYQIKGPIIIFHMKGHAVKLKCVNYKIFWKNMIFAKKHLFKAWKYAKLWYLLSPTKKHCFETVWW